MSEVALWLDYALSGVIAFLLIYYLSWRIVPSMLVGTAFSLAVYLTVLIGRGVSLGDPWLPSALFINGCFALIAAFVGSAIGFSVTRRAGDG